MARQPNGQAKQRDEIRRLHRLGHTPRQIMLQTGSDPKYVRSVLSRHEYGPGGRMAQNVEDIHLMVSECLAILRSLTRLPRGELIRRIAEIAQLEPPSPDGEATGTQSSQPQNGQTIRPG